MKKFAVSTKVPSTLVEKRRFLEQCVAAVKMSNCLLAREATKLFTRSMAHPVKFIRLSTTSAQRKQWISILGYVHKGTDINYYAHHDLIEVTNKGFFTGVGVVN